MDFVDGVLRPLIPTLFFLGAPFVFLKLDGLKFKASFERLNLRAKDVRLSSLLEAVKLFVLMYTVLIVESLILSYFHVMDLEKVSGVLKHQDILVLVAAVTITPIAEELFFRGYLQGKFGAVLSALAFGFLHFVYGSTDEVVFAVSIGLLFGWYVRKHKKLLPTILAHAAFNAVSVYFLLHPVG